MESAHLAVSQSTLIIVWGVTSAIFIPKESKTIKRCKGGSKRMTTYTQEADDCVAYLQLAYAVEPKAWWDWLPTHLLIRHGDFQCYRHNVGNGDSPTVFCIGEQRRSELLSCGSWDGIQRQLYAYRAMLFTDNSCQKDAENCWQMDLFCALCSSSCCEKVRARSMWARMAGSLNYSLPSLPSLWWKEFPNLQNL